MMGRSTRFHGNGCIGFNSLSHAIDLVVAPASATEDIRSTLINRVEMEDVLGEMNTDNSNAHDSAPFQVPGSYLRDRVGGVHPIAVALDGTLPFLTPHLNLFTPLSRARPINVVGRLTEYESPTIFYYYPLL